MKMWAILIVMFIIILIIWGVSAKTAKSDQNIEEPETVSVNSQITLFNPLLYLLILVPFNLF